MSSAPIWQLGEKVLVLDRPRIMAIVNADPESFYPGSRIGAEPALIRERLALLAEQGADILDIGGQSTRPGSVAVGAEEELQRVLPVLEAAVELSLIRERDGGTSLAVSVDTFHAQVAREALAIGVDCVNDISSGRMDSGLWDVIAGGNCGYVLMHMLGTPADMQQSPQYNDCVAEVGAFLREKLDALIALGVDPARVVLDPGIGFGKRLEDNLALIKGAERLRYLVAPHGCAALLDPGKAGTAAHPCGPTEDTAGDKPTALQENSVPHVCAPPLLYGLSRKSFIKTLMSQSGRPEAAAQPEQRLPASLGATWHLLDQGVMLHRVHDVAETRQLMTMWEGLNSSSTDS